MTLGVLASFRWIERKMPAQIFYQFDVYFARNATMNEHELRKIIEKNGFSIANFSYQMERKDRIKRHSMILRTLDRANAAELFKFLEGEESVLKVRITPTGDK